ncbi:uncharacterized protein V6R79_011687 [Siganus canaliculatus]
MDLAAARRPLVALQRTCPDVDWDRILAESKSIKSSPLGPWRTSFTADVNVSEGPDPAADTSSQGLMGPSGPGSRRVQDHPRASGASAAGTKNLELELNLNLEEAAWFLGSGLWSR